MYEYMYSNVVYSSFYLDQDIYNKAVLATISVKSISKSWEIY